MVKVVLALAGCAVLTGCGAATVRDTPATPSGTTTLVRSGVRAAPALVVASTGKLLVGERASGIVLAIDRRHRASRPFPRLRVSTDGQRGLLALAVLGHRTFATWTTSARRLVVGELLRRHAPRIVWLGPRTSTLANGGHLAAAPSGRLVIGIGDLQHGHQAGQILSLDPDGAPDQDPTVLSAGWNNPYAFTFTPSGQLWVADNSPGRAPERLARGDRGTPTDVTTLPVKTAPSGIAAVDENTLAICGFVSGRLDRYVRRSDGWTRAATIADGCRYGVTAHPGRRLAFATDDAILEVRP